MILGDAPETKWSVRHSSRNILSNIEQVCNVDGDMGVWPLYSILHQDKQR